MPNRAWLLSGPEVPDLKYYSTRFRLDQNALHTLSRTLKVTITVFLSALYADALQELYLEEVRDGRSKKGLPVRMQIPVNLRKDYPSKTMRNFSYIYSPAFYVSHKPMEFEKLVQNIAEAIRHERHSGFIRDQIARNLRSERLWIIRFGPRWFKNWIMRGAYHFMGRNLYTGYLTSMGAIQLPDSLSSKVTSFDILPCATPVPGRNSAMYSYKGIMDLVIGRTVDDTRLEDQIAEKLTVLGLDFTREDRQSLF